MNTAATVKPQPKR